MKINNTKTQGHLIVAAVATALLIAGGKASAQELAAPEKKTWETTAAAGLTLINGNRDSLLFTAGLTTNRKWEKDELAFGVSGGYGEDDNNPTQTSTVNAEFIQGFGQYNHFFGEKFYGGLRLDAAYDGIANLDYRVSITPLAGYYIIKNTNTTFAVEVGPSAVFEKFSGESSDSYLGIRFAERSEHKLTESTKIWQSVSYVPDVENWMDRYVITAEAGIDAAISKKWSLRVVLQNIYTSEPAANTDNNELRLVAGTAYKF